MLWLQRCSGRAYNGGEDCGSGFVSAAAGIGVCVEGGAVCEGCARSLNRALMER